MAHKSNCHVFDINSVPSKWSLNTIIPPDRECEIALTFFSAKIPFLPFSAFIAEGGILQH